MKSRALLFVAVGALSGCTTLPVDPGWQGNGCRGTGTDMVIHGSMFDQLVSWVELPEGGGRVNIVWPVGYRARFVPTLEIVDRTGAIVAREGDRLQGWCRNASSPDDAPVHVEGDQVVRTTSAAIE